MFDIYKVTPRHNALHRTIIAGNYASWVDVVSAIDILYKLSRKKPNGITPLFEVQLCVHRKSSTQYKVIVSHTAPMTIEELKALL